MNYLFNVMCKYHYCYHNWIIYWHCHFNQDGHWTSGRRDPVTHFKSFICPWYSENVHLVMQDMSQEKQKIIANLISAILKVVCILCVCFGTVLSHVVLQLIRPFAGEVALLAGKRFLAGVWQHVVLQNTGETGRVAALLSKQCLHAKGFSPVCVSLWLFSSPAWAQE